jgi:hypothetical protein
MTEPAGAFLQDLFFVPIRVLLSNGGSRHNSSRFPHAKCLSQSLGRSLTAKNLDDVGINQFNDRGASSHDSRISFNVGNVMIGHEPKLNILATQ